jgi:hypothetical protein
MTTTSRSAKKAAGAAANPTWHSNFGTQIPPTAKYAIEAGHHNLEIYNNMFRNGFYPIASFGHTVENLRIHHNTFDGIENHGVCNLPAAIDFSFTHNIVVIKRDMHLLNLGGKNRPSQSRNITITHNLLVKDGGPTCPNSVVNPRPGASLDLNTVTVRNNASWNWAPDGESPKVIDPILERATDGDKLLRLSPQSPFRAVGIGCPPIGIGIGTEIQTEVETRTKPTGQSN